MLIPYLAMLAAGPGAAHALCYVAGEGFRFEQLHLPHASQHGEPHDLAFDDPAFPQVAHSKAHCTDAYLFDGYCGIEKVSLKPAHARLLFALPIDSIAVHALAARWSARDAFHPSGFSPHIPSTILRI